MVGEDEARPKVALELSNASALNDLVGRSHDWLLAVVVEEEDGGGGAVGRKRRKRKRKRTRSGLIYYLADWVNTE
jgi:hypothetical protein